MGVSRRNGHRFRPPMTEDTGIVRQEYRLALCGMFKEISDGITMTSKQQETIQNNKPDLKENRNEPWI